VKEYTSEKIGIPSPEEIPNIDLRVVNYHRPAMGTFHAKYVIVDRKYALVCSNNIQVCVMPQTLVETDEF
jgi:hypothetical protein